jgi:Skp family chaperone for outer membrane proteins
LQNSELEQNFKQISEIVHDWSTKEKLDIVINKSQALFVSEKYDATSKIVDILKEKELYQEYNESEFLIEM